MHYGVMLAMPVQGADGRFLSPRALSKIRGEERGWEYASRDLIQAGADVWVLGCTHFPFLAAGLRQIAGPGVQLIDPADAVARELSRRLNEHPGLVSEVTAGAVATPGADYFFTTGDVAQTSAVISQLWGQPVRAQSL